MTFDAHQLLLYAVTDRAWVGRQTLAEQIEDALLGGATMLQLREKELDRPSFLAEAREIKALCRRYGVPLIIDDDVEVALESGADGVHVGQADLPVAEIRRRAGRGFIIGATAKTVAQARAAEAAGADSGGGGGISLAHKTGGPSHHAGAAAGDLRCRVDPGGGHRRHFP